MLTASLAWWLHDLEREQSCGENLETLTLLECKGDLLGAKGKCPGIFSLYRTCWHCWGIAVMYLAPPWLRRFAGPLCGQHPWVPVACSKQLPACSPMQDTGPCWWRGQRWGENLQKGKETAGFPLDRGLAVLFTLERQPDFKGLEKRKRGRRHRGCTGNTFEVLC